MGDRPSAPGGIPSGTLNTLIDLKMVVSVPELTEVERRGLPVLSYCIEIDRVLDNNFKPLQGCSTDSLGLDVYVSGLNIGQSYGFRYKARNEYGWSDYSQVSTILVASRPRKPSEAPTFIDSTATEIIIGISVDQIENNGSPILEYALEIAPDADTAF